MERLTSDQRASGQRPGGSIDLTFNAVIPYCLVYLKSDSRVLLIRKSAGRSHQGEWIGLGGKIESGEDPVSSAVREFREESGLTLGNPELRGILVWIDEVKCGIVHIVTGTQWSGVLSESEEGEVRWHYIQDLPTLHGLAEHQLLFIDRILLHDDGFYSGVAVFRNSTMIQYLDSERSVVGP